MIRSWCYIWCEHQGLVACPAIMSCLVAYWTKPPAGGRVCLMISFKIAKTQTVGWAIWLRLWLWQDQGSQESFHGSWPSCSTQVLNQPERQLIGQQQKPHRGGLSHGQDAKALVKVLFKRRNCCKQWWMSHWTVHGSHWLSWSGNNIKWQNEVTSCEHVLTIMLWMSWLRRTKHILQCQVLMIYFIQSHGSKLSACLPWSSQSIR